MPQNKMYISEIIDDKNKIAEYVELVSPIVHQHVCNSNSRFVLYYKFLTHSDLATFGKATRPQQYEKNLLYYLTTEEIQKIESSMGKNFQSSHQSNIGLKEKLYDIVGLPRPRETKPYLLNDYMDVFLVNSNLEYFTLDYTNKIFDKLHKKATKEFEKGKEEIFEEFNGRSYLPIDLHVAVHGIGKEEDIIFHQLRHNMFNGDIISLLFELNKKGRGRLYIMLKKNPAFFTILGEQDVEYENYQRNLLMQTLTKVGKTNIVDDSHTEIDRTQQATWRRLLAEESMAYSLDKKVVCPITYIRVDFEQLGALFVASHIKGFSDKNTTDEEKYDIYNGLLLSSNADALFDKHLITIDKNKKLRISFLLEKDILLKEQLQLHFDILTPFLNEQRMKYLKYHYDIFCKLEEQRKLGDYSYIVK